MRITSRCCWVATVASLFLGETAAAQDECHIATLYPSNGHAGDWFGSSISIDGDRMLVGAELSDNGGSAYVFGRGPGGWSEWVEEAILEVDTSGQNSTTGFGENGVLSGDYAIIGAPSWDRPGDFNAGTVFVFRRDVGAWIQEAQIFPSENTFGFGTNISFDGATIAACDNNDFFAFEKDVNGSWQQQTIQGASTVGWGCSSIAVLGDTLMVGDAGEGGLHVFKRNPSPMANPRWDQFSVQISSPPPPSQEIAYLGNIVRMDSQHVYLVGQITVNGVDIGGVVRVFRRDGAPETWTFLGDFRTSDARGYLGVDRIWSLGIDGGHFVVGTPFHWLGGIETGAAYLFGNPANGASPEKLKLMPTELQLDPTLGFGWSVGIGQGIMAVGIRGKGTGIVQIFQPLSTPPDCDGNGVKDSCDTFLTDCMELEPPEGCETTPIAGTDCNQNQTPDECEFPAPEAVGCRRFSVTPPAGNCRVAILVSSLEFCVDKAVNPSGFLLSSGPQYRTPAEWGTIVVYGAEIVPNRQYEVTLITVWGEFKGTASVTTGLWGNVVGAEHTNFADIAGIVNRFRNISTAPSEELCDIGPAVPDGVVNFVDIADAVDAFRNLAFSYPVPPQYCP